MNCSLFAFCVAVHFDVVGAGRMLMGLLLVYLLMRLLTLLCVRVSFRNLMRAQELIERERKAKETGREKNLKMMVWQCKGCLLFGNPDFMKPQKDFGVRNESDFVTWLLPQGSWARCTSCSHKLQHQFGKDGGESTHSSAGRFNMFLFMYSGS